MSALSDSEAKDMMRLYQPTCKRTANFPRFLSSFRD